MVSFQVILILRHNPMYVGAQEVLYIPNNLRAILLLGASSSCPTGLTIHFWQLHYMSIRFINFDLLDSSDVTNFTTYRGRYNYFLHIWLLLFSNNWQSPCKP